MNSTIKLFLTDDEPLFRGGIAFILDREVNIEVIGEAGNGEELIQYLKTAEILPDMIIMDLNMPVLNGVETTKIISQDFPTIKVIALTSFDTPAFIANMFDVGAVSYAIKSCTPADLIKTINEVNDKGFYYNNQAVEKIQKTTLTRKNNKSRFDADYLTPREIEVLKLICEQKNTTEIAEVLFLSPRTVEGHRNNLLLKTESRNIAGLVVYAIENEIATLKNSSR